MQFAGKRPVLTEGFGVCLSVLPSASLHALDTSPLLRISSSPILHASILIAPVPYFSTQSATVSLRPVSASISGFLTTIIGSWLGLSDVPHPSHLWASSVAGAVNSVFAAVLVPSTSPPTVNELPPGPFGYLSAHF